MVYGEFRLDCAGIIAPIPKRRSATNPMKRIFVSIVAVSAALLPMASAQNLPTSWVDKDTGHRIHRLTDEPGSSGFYFNVNAFTPDGKAMVYNSPDGIRVLDLASYKTRLLVPNPPRPADAAPGTPGFFRGGVHTIVVGRKTNSVFFSKMDSATNLSTIYKANIDTGEVTKLATLPPRASVATVNADETLGVGTYNENETPTEQEYGRNRPQAAAAAPSGSQTQQAGNLVQPEGKGEMMERRLAARIQMCIRDRCRSREWRQSWRGDPGLQCGRRLLRLRGPDR